MYAWILDNKNNETFVEKKYVGLEKNSTIKFDTNTLVKMYSTFYLFTRLALAIL